MRTQRFLLIAFVITSIILLTVGIVSLIRGTEGPGKWIGIVVGGIGILLTPIGIAVLRSGRESGWPW